MKWLLFDAGLEGSESLPPRGAWIEIPTQTAREYIAAMSLPPRGAWIEIAVHPILGRQLPSLPPRGAWIEISSSSYTRLWLPRRSPHGERGLKFNFDRNIIRVRSVAPPTGSVD